MVVKTQGRVKLPTQEEIAKECKEIQKGWSRTEERLRRSGRETRYTVPEVRSHLFDEKSFRTARPIKITDDRDQ